MSRYYLRLDDASDYMDLEKWNRMEHLLDKYSIKPIFGIIPKNCDKSLLSQYEHNPKFWELMHSWIKKGWTPAMHGYEHRYVTREGGLNPVNRRSEFAGLSYEEHAEKIRKGYQILVSHNIRPLVFFAPSHTFDENTLKALKEETPIRIISDTIAWDIYKDGDFYYIPQQSGNVRKLPFSTVTFCYHPNTMDDKAFIEIEEFIKKNKEHMQFGDKIHCTNRKKNILDKMLQSVYLKMHEKT